VNNIRVDVSSKIADLKTKIRRVLRVNVCPYLIEAMDLEAAMRSLELEIRIRNPIEQVVKNEGGLLYYASGDPIHEPNTARADAEQDVFGHRTGGVAADSAIPTRRTR
jgi:hypothetical protein